MEMKTRDGRNEKDGKGDDAGTEKGFYLEGCERGMLRLHGSKEYER